MGHHKVARRARGRVSDPAQPLSAAHIFESPRLCREMVTRQEESVMRSRLAGRNFLFVPGPTNVPDRVQRAMMVAMEDHRSSKFPELSTSVLNDLKNIFKTTTGQVFIFPSSGTGAWEAALTNTLSPGDKILAARFGQFSHLWIDMARSEERRVGKECRDRVWEDHEK